jgi:hypothetical protein
MKFDSLAPDGAGILISNWQDSTPTGDNPPASGEGLMTIWADQGQGVYVDFDQRYTISDNSLGYHIYRLDYIDGQCSLYVDDELKSGPLECNAPNNIWIGNPVFTHWTESDWTDYTIDYVSVASPSDVEPTDVEPTSFNPQTITSTPQLIFVQSGGGGSTPSNSDVATSSDGDDAYIVWEEGGDIMFRAGHGCADANGCEFGDILNLSNNAGRSTEARVATSSDGRTVLVAWQDNTPGNDEIFFSRSIDFGATFNGGNPVGNAIDLSNTRGASNDQQLVIEGPNAYLVWTDFQTGNGDIYFKRSNNFGESFVTNPTASPTNLSRGSGLSFLASRDPDMAAQGSLVAVTWSVHPDKAARGPGEIIFRESGNGGVSFGIFNVVSKTLAASKEPQVDYTPGHNERYVAWHDKGGPPRKFTTPGTFNVLASESNDGKRFSAPVNLSNAPNTLDKGRDTSQLQIVDDVAIWDPSGRRG